MKRQLIHILIFTSLFITHSSYAYTSYSHSCGAVINYDNEGSDFARVGYPAYIRGYITGRNYELNATQANDVDSDSLYYAVVKFCRDNPLKDTNDAAKYIYSNLN